MPIAWETVENSIRAAVRDALGLPDGSVIWADQDGTRPAEPFATVKLGTLVSLGQDATTHDFDSGRPAGEEIEITVRGVRELPVSVQVFAPSTTGNGSAFAILSKLPGRLRLASVRDPLTLAGLSPFDVGGVQNLGQLLGPAFAGRATCDVRFYVADDVSERTTYIETVEIDRDE